MKNKYSKNDKFTTILILSLAFWLCIGFGIYLYIERVDEIRRSKAVVPKHISDRMNNYHGTLDAYEKWDGKIYFKDTSGKECKL